MGNVRGELGKHGVMPFPALVVGGKEGGVQAAGEPVVEHLHHKSVKGRVELLLQRQAVVKMMAHV